MSDGWRWTMADEIYYIERLAGRVVAAREEISLTDARVRVLEGYLRGVEYRHDWQGMDKQRIVSAAQNALSEARYRKEEA